MFNECLPPPTSMPSITSCHLVALRLAACCLAQVAALAQELQGTDTSKLKLIDLIGQGAHGSVYRGACTVCIACPTPLSSGLVVTVLSQTCHAGVWRNLEVAVKTVLFSDRTGMSSGASGNNKNSVSQLNCICNMD